MARSPARWIAPLALAGALVAIVYVISSSTGDGSGAGTSATERPARSGTTTTSERREERRRPRTYTVQEGDILSSVAEKTGVSVERLRELNPDVDANALSIGQKLRLSAP